MKSEQNIKGRRLKIMCLNEEVHFPLMHAYKNFGMIPYMYRHWKPLSGEKVITKQEEKELNKIFHIQ